MHERPIPKAAFGVASSREDLRAFPRAVQREFGRALRVAQLGGKHEAAKPLKGFKGGSVLEIVEDHDGNTYRAVYTVRFADAVYVLHVFQKKAKKGIKTPKHVINLIKTRLRTAEQDHRNRTKQHE
jgi:phage-related protein